MCRGARASSYADGGDGLACWTGKLMRDCQQYYPGVDLIADWSDVNSTVIFEGNELVVPSKLVVPASLNVSADGGGALVDHVNLHACRVASGFCSPFADVSPGLVTHSAQERGGYGPYRSATILMNDADDIRVEGQQFVYWVRATPPPTSEALRAPARRPWPRCDACYVRCDATCDATRCVLRCASARR
jgi:hypothetical protein